MTVLPLRTTVIVDWWGSSSFKLVVLSAGMCEIDLLVADRPVLEIVAEAAFDVVVYVVLVVVFV